MLVIEAWDRVSIGLLRRMVSGEAPDGTMYGESLQLGRQVSLDVALRARLEPARCTTRRPGEVVPRVERRSDDPLPAEAAGTVTPLWRWS